MAGRCLVCGLPGTEEEHDRNDRHASEVVPGLFVGGIETAHNATELFHKKIRAIVNVAAHDISCKHAEAGIAYRRFCWDDAERFDILPALPSLCDFIQEHLDAKQVVLVHCRAGVSRSVAAVIAYLTSIAAVHHDERRQCTTSRWSGDR